MKYEGNLIVVKDMEKSKAFYREILGQEVIMDFGANVTFTGGFSLQTADSWLSFIHKQENELSYGGNVTELYFEETDLDAFMAKLRDYQIEYVHPLQEHDWGQRGIRFYDPDKHIIEVGEYLGVVVKRFVDSGMTIEQTSERMGIPLDYAKSYLS